MSLYRFPRTSLALAVLATTGSGVVQAATDAFISSSELEEIVVTASRTKQRIFDSPASLSVIDETELARATVPGLAELIRDVPGVQVTDSGQPGLGRIRIRGEESRRTAILINSQEVTDHYEVGTPLTLHPAMVERIEVMRGSGSVLYGSRALSGVVNFITRKGGTEPLQATVEGGYDSATDGYNSFASLYGNAAGFEYRLAGSKSDHDDRATPSGSMENTSYDNDSVYLYAGRGFGAQRLEYTYEKFSSSSNVYVEDEVKTSYPLTDFYIESPKRDRDKHGLFYTWDVDNSWLQSFSANAYQQQNDRHFYTYSETVWYSRDINNYSTLDTDGALAQMDFQPLGDHRLIAGVQYLNDDVDQTRHVDTVSWTPPIAATGVEVIRDKASIETWAMFLQDQWEISDRLSMTAGLRQYYVDAKLDDTDRESLNPGNLGSDDELVGALGLVWGVSDDVHLRANVAQGYVYPSLTQLATGAYAGSNFVNPDASLDPETSTNYELGLRMQSRQLTLDTTAFYTESDDYIHHLACTPEDDCPGRRDRLYQNVGKSNAHGVEMFVVYGGLPQGLEPYASLTWMKRKIEYDQFSTWHTEVPDISGRVGMKWQGSVMSVPLMWADLFLRGESSSKLEEPDTVRDTLDDKSGWVTVNLSTGVEFGSNNQYQLSMDLLNLTDKEYIASTENLYGSERSVAMKLSLNW
ncbi:MAG: TonB-dependent receptor [Pseudomonadales bacterium]|nr:TonB-dependent receptor [Halioglobus sp.]MCP5128619.1 TonB-dependent receptor [Pseudomonadales bacterium]